MHASAVDTTGYKAYKTFQAIKQHFTSKYDYFKYNGKVKTSITSFIKRKDKFKFAKIETKHKSDLIQFIVSNAIKDNIGWIGDLTTEEAETNYISWRKKTEALRYHFKTELQLIKEELEHNGFNFNTLFEIKAHEHPLLLKLAFQEKISLESLVIIDRLLSFSTLFNKKMVDDLLWIEYNRKIQKYSAFLMFEKTPYKKILQTIFL